MSEHIIECGEGPTQPKSLHHLMRVRVRRSLFDRLKEIAQEESGDSGEYTSVSDIVRAALLTWIQTYESTSRLRAAVSPPLVLSDTGMLSETAPILVP